MRGIVKKWELRRLRRELPDGSWFIWEPRVGAVCRCDVPGRGVGVGRERPEGDVGETLASLS